MKQDYFDAKTKRLIGQAKRKKKAVYLEIKRNNNMVVIMSSAIPSPEQMKGLKNIML